MIRPVALAFMFFIFLSPLACLATEKGDALQTPLSQHPAQAKKYPGIVLYSVAWCPHCTEAKKYLTEHNIPFINRDVELDSKAMDELTGKYQSQGVPVIVIGNDEKVLKGFSKEEFEKALGEVRGAK